MVSNPLSSLQDYSEYLAHLVQRPSVEHSTVNVRLNSRQTGIAVGEVWFKNGMKLRMREYLHEEKLYWYDSLPHPNIASLQETLPHHKHIPPNIGRNRIPAPELSFTKPNLPFILEEIKRHF